MMGYALAMVAAVGTGVVLNVAFSLFIKLYRRNTRLLELASKDFTAAVNSLLKTPQDLPDGVLEILNMMSRTAFSRRAGGVLIRQIRHVNRPMPKPAIMEQVEQLRPELRDLFHQAVVSWLNIVANRGLLMGLRVDHALMRARRRAAQSSEADEAEVALPAIREMASNAEPKLCAA